MVDSELILLHLKAEDMVINDKNNLRHVRVCVTLDRCFFFFSSRRRHTRFDCDWSSDVCSSDLERNSPLSMRLVLFRTEEARTNWSDMTSLLRGLVKRLPSLCAKGPRKCSDLDRKSVV